ncbi:MAG: hypothetical protein MJA28_05775 [Gammaproteobacteria bacterium]|nr:hypothetical protein [Gammaproteobacteria bacterium]
MDEKNSQNHKDGAASERYYPKFLVTQAEYDAATPEERERYIVDESVLEPPRNYSIPDEA